MKKTEFSDGVMRDTMRRDSKTVVCIGGSAGSLKPVIRLLKELKVDGKIVVFICIHRGKNRTENFCKLLSEQSGKKIVEPDDKDPVEFGKCYMAPANYHLTLDRSGYISLAYEDEVNYSRPSIDVMFKSVAGFYKDATIGVILSGANSDGAKGLERVKTEKGICVIQNPDTAAVPAMPLASRQIIPEVLAYDPEQIGAYINLVSCLRM